MSFKDVTGGTKRAKAKAMRFIKTSKGTPAMEVEFEFIEPSTNAPERLTWQGWLTPGAIKRTRETLDVILGYNGDKKTDFNGMFTHPQVLDFKREVDIVVELEDYKDKRYPKIKWVNAIGGSKYGGVSPETSESELDALGWDAHGVDTQKQDQTPTPPKGIVPDEELPY